VASALCILIIIIIIIIIITFYANCIKSHKKQKPTT